MEKKPPLSFKREVIKNSFWNFLETLTSNVGGLIFATILARILFPESFGIYSLVLALVMAISAFLDMGINQATAIKYISESIGKKRKDKARAYFYVLFKTKILIAFFASILLFILAKPIAFHVFNKPFIVAPIQFGAIYLFTTFLFPFFMSIFSAVQKFRYLFFGQFIFQILRAIFVFGLLTLVKDVSVVFIGLAISSGLVVLFLVFSLRKNFKFILKGPKTKIDKKKLVSFSLFLSLITLSSLFFVYIDKIIIGILLPIEYTGYYTVALTLVFGVASLVTFSTVLLPVFTQLEKNLSTVFGKVFRYSAILSIPMAFGLIFFSKGVIGFVYGKDYLMGALPLYFLAFLIIESTTLAFFSTAFISKDKLKFPAMMMVIAAILNLVLNYLLITYLSRIKLEYGLVGAAISTIISRYLFSISLVIKARKDLGIKLDKSWILKPLLASLIMFFSLLFIDRLLGLKFPISLIEVFIGAGIYFLVMFLIKGIEKKDFLL